MATVMEEREAEFELDEFGLLRHHGEWVSLSPTQESLMRRLLGRFGRPVSREELAAELTPPRPAEARTIDAHVLRLRERIAPMGLSITTIRGRGFVLAAADQD